MAENSENQNLPVEDGEGGEVSGMGEETENGENYESNLNPELSPRAATADTDVDRSGGDNFSTVAHRGSVDRESSVSPAEFVEGKEQVDDDFVDAPDQLSLMSDARSVTGESTHYVEPQEESDENHDSRVDDDGKQVRQLTYELALCQASLEKTTVDNEIIVQKHKEEREMLGRELANLHRQLEMMSNKQYSRTDDDGNVVVDHLPREEQQHGENETRASDTSLQLMIADCFKSLGVLQKNFEDQLQYEGTARELQAVLLTKDQEIESLSAKVDELSVSNDVIASYMESLRQTVSQSLQESYEGRMERDMHVDGVMNKLLVSLGSVVQQEEFSEGSSVEKISHLEKSTFLMVENYNRILSEIGLLKQCLIEHGKDVKISEDAEFSTVFDTVRRELLEHKRMEDDFIEKFNQVENENNKLLEQIDQAKERMEVTDGEVGKLKMELEQEKSKSSSTKDKLGMAVTRGKALVQQRDSLKQTLNEKTNELEKCLLELQEKSNALESAELRNEELVQSKSLVESLQESLSKKATVLGEIEEILSQSDISDGLHLTDIIECVRELVNQKKALMDVSLEYNKLKNLLSSFNLPEAVAASKMEAQLSWLWESHCDAEKNITTLQGEVISSRVTVASLESVLAEAFNEIDQLRTSISVEKKERDSLEMGLQDLSSKYEAVVDREFQATFAKDRMTKLILEACGVEDQGELGEPYPDIGVFVDKCIGKIKDQSITTHLESSYIGTEQFEKIQSYLYVRDQELMLCESVLEEEGLKSSEMATLADELKKASEEIMTLKGEKDSLERNLERSYEKYSQLREKLSMAVKKGKGLFQEREGIKKSLEEKNREIENLKLELQQQESVLNGCRDEIKRLTSDLERFSQIEVELFALKDEKNQLEKYLLQSNNMLERVVESMESVVPVDTVFEEPVGKVKWLADSLNEYRIDKVNADKDLEKVKEEANFLSEKLTEAHATIQSLENALSETETSKILLAEEIKELQTVKAHLEQELEQAKEEASSLDSKFAEASANIKALEEALSQAENNTSVLEEEKAAASLSKNTAEKELEKAKEEAEFQANKLVEAYATIKSLEEGLSQLEKNVSVLTEEKNATQAGMVSLERDFEKFQGEAGSQASKLAGLNATVKSLEDALSVAENNITVLTDSLSRAEKNISILEEEKVAAEQELKRAKEEAEHQASKLAETYRTIESLEEGISQLEKNVSVLTEEKNAAQAGMASLESDLEISRGEASSQASKLVDVYATVKSLEDALSAAEDNISVLTKKRENAEMEIQALNDKLSTGMVELAGVHGSSGDQSEELFSQLNRLQVIMNDNQLLSSLTQDFKRKFERLRDMNQLLDNIRDQFVERSPNQLQTNANTERDSYALKMFSASIDTFLNGEIDSFKTNEDVDDVMSYITKIIDGFNKKNKVLEDKFEYFSSSVDELIVFLLKALQATKDNVIDMLEHMESLKLDVRNLGAYKQAAESSTFALTNDLKMLLSSWSDAAGELGFQMDNSLPNLRSNQEQGNLDNDLHLRIRKVNEDASEQHHESVDDSDYVESTQNLISEIRSQIKTLENVKNFTLTVIEEHQNKLNDSQLTSENAVQERDLNQNRISMLEEELKALQDFCNEMKMKLKDYEAIEGMLKEKDSELRLLHRSLATKEQESKGYLLSEDQVKTLFEKIDQIGILPEERDLEKKEPLYSGPLEKLFDVIDNVTQLQHQMRLLSHDNEELQASLSTRVDEMKNMKREMLNLASINQDLGETRNGLAELSTDLKLLIQKLGGNNASEDNKLGVKGLVTTLENLVMASIHDCETSKAKAQESGVKLHENQKVVVELSEKVKLLEDSINSRPALSDSVQERNIFKESPLPTGSEISEIEDGAPLGRNSMSPGLPAAHVRTLRKGSSDHLAIAIDSESERLVNRHEIDDDKGHTFKSLNTSGLIPKQGKLMADRIDGIWVNGGRILMSRPRARIGVIAYCLLMHFWILGTIL